MRKLVDRVPERKRFRSIVQRLSNVEGQVLALSGEAGVGKTRLMNDFMEHCRSVCTTGLLGRCHFYGSSVPYLPWAQVLRDLADIRRRESAEESRKKLEKRLAEANPELAGWSPLLGTVVGIPIPDTELTALLTPRQRKEKIFAIFLEMFRAQARKGPTFIVLEDVHWIDPLSRELLVYLSSRIRKDPLLILVEQRSEFELPEWGADSRVTNIELSPLSREYTVEMLQMLLGTNALPEQLSRLVLEKTQGNPFYVEEMVRALLEAKHLVWDPTKDRHAFVDDAVLVDMPGTIQGLILSRVDRLPEHLRKTIQVASVFGRSFALGVLQSVLPFEPPRDQLDSGIQELVRLELIVPDESLSHGNYFFKHALVQEVVYESLSYAARRMMHRLIGEELERACGGEYQEQCDVLARHFDLGRVPEKALEYLVMAGDKAREAFANKEAADYYERALVHLHSLGSRSRQPLLVRLLEDLGDVYSLNGDYAAAVSRYQQVLERVEGAVKHARLEGKIGSVFYRYGEPHQGIEHLEAGLGHLGIRAPRTRWQVRTSLARQILTQMAHTMLPRVFVRQRSRDEESAHAAIEIYEALSRISFEFDLEKTLDAHLRQLNLCETIPGSPQMAQTYSSHGIVCGTVPLFDRAIRYQRRGLAIREDRRDRWGVAQSSNFMGICSYWMGNWEQALACLDRSAQIFNDVGDRWETEVTYLIFSFIYLRKGELERAVDHARTSLDLSRRAEDPQGMGWALGALAEAYSRQGKLEEALAHGQEALACSEQARDRMYLSVVRRVLGNIYLRMDDGEQALEEMRRSLKQITDYRLRHEFVLGAYPGLAEARLAVLASQPDMDPRARRITLGRIRKLCRQAVGKAQRFKNWLGYAYRVWALCEWAADRPQSAKHLFESSIETSNSMGARYDLGMTYYDMARFLLELGRPGAASCLDNATRLFRECGALMDRERAEALSVHLPHTVSDRSRVHRGPHLPLDEEKG
jgi:tetratricopeptide (TPR) repeat protein